MEQIKKSEVILKNKKTAEKTRAFYMPDIPRLIEFAAMAPFLINVLRFISAKIFLVIFGILFDFHAAPDGLEYPFKNLPSFAALSMVFGILFFSFGFAVLIFVSLPKTIFSIEEKILQLTENIFHPESVPILKNKENILFILNTASLSFILWFAYFHVKLGSNPSFLTALSIIALYIAWRITVDFTGFFLFGGRYEEEN